MHLEFVTSDVTFTEELAVTASSPLYRWLARPDASAWARLLRAHLDRWFSGPHASSLQHDALTLSAALELPFVDFTPRHVHIDDDGRMREDQNGSTLTMSRRADYPAFQRWLHHELTRERIAAVA